MFNAELGCEAARLTCFIAHDGVLLFSPIHGVLRLFATVTAVCQLLFIANGCDTDRPRQPECLSVCRVEQEKNCPMDINSFLLSLHLY